MQIRMMNLITNENSTGAVGQATAKVFVSAQNSPSPYKFER